MNESNYQFRGTDDYIISDDLMLGANAAGFVKVANAMVAQGVL